MADINSIEQLDAIRTNKSGVRIIGTYNLLRDLDFNDPASYDNPANMSTYTTGNGWVPLGLWHTDYFGGVFNGNGHTISNLYMNNREAAGLFGVIDVCTIRDVGLINPSVNQTTTANWTEAGTLIGGIDPSGPGGGSPGLVLIENCYSKGGATGDDDHVGGFLGICHMYSTADVTIRNCYTTSAVNEKGTYQDGFGLGGFIGTLNVVSTGGSIKIENCYSAGSVTSGNTANSTGGFAGFYNNAALVTSCFWDTQTSGRATSATSAVGKTTAQMKTLSTFSNASWNIADEASYAGQTWYLPTAGGYPELYFEYVAPTPPDPDPDPEPEPPISNYTPTPVEEKTFYFKVYDEDGNYLGQLNDVMSDPEWSHEINSLAQSMELELARSSDSIQPDIQSISTEDDQEILTEDSQVIEGLLTVGQNIGPGTLVDYNNRIDVVAFYGSTDTITAEDGEDLWTEDEQELLTTYSSPNGRRLFTGFISQIQSRYGNTETTKLTVISYGYDLMHYPIVDVDGKTTVAFNSTDPGLTMRSIMDIFKDQGVPEGTYTDYDTDSIELVGYDASYTFKANTVEEGIEKANELAAASGSWYYYVDLGTNLLHFHQRTDEAKHTFVLGEHIEGLDLNGNIENTVNDVLFTGGGDPPLYKRKTDPIQPRTRRGLVKLSDNRVTLDDSADLLIEGQIAQNTGQQYKSTVTILSTTYDIESIVVGDVVTFRNFNNFIDTLKMQVVGIKYNPDKVDLQLDTLPPRISQRLQDLKRALAQTDNANVPDTPAS